MTSTTMLVEPGVVDQMIVDLLELPGLCVLPTLVSAVQTLTELLRRCPVTGAGIFDLQIVATMQANDIQCICTFNTADFEIFPNLPRLRRFGRKVTIDERPDAIFAAMNGNWVKFKSTMALSAFKGSV